VENRTIKGRQAEELSQPNAKTEQASVQRAQDKKNNMKP
jgi:hypothetical protein